MVSSAFTSSAWVVQHTQPPVISTSTRARSASSSPSMPTSPTSLTMTATSPDAASVSQRLTNVVLPAPKKPVTTVTGSVALMPRSVPGGAPGYNHSHKPTSPVFTG